MKTVDANALRDALYEADAITMQGVAIINNFPCVDAVEVVRCKDCQKSKVKQMSIPGDDLFRQFPMYVCEHPRGEVGTDPLYMEADDFCSYGERRNDE